MQFYFIINVIDAINLRVRVKFLCITIFFVCKKECSVHKFGDRSIIRRERERVGTAVNKNPGLIFFEQCHRCSCSPVWRVATLFFHTVQSLSTERNSCRHSKRKLMVLLFPARGSRKFITILPRKIYLPDTRRAQNRKINCKNSRRPERRVFEIFGRDQEENIYL